MKKLSLVTLAILSLVFSGCSEAGAITSSKDAIAKITEHFGTISKAADTVKDEASAKAANTKITDVVGKLSGVMDIVKKLPAGKDEVINKAKELAGPVLSKLTGSAFKAQLQGAIEKLQGLIK